MDFLVYDKQKAQNPTLSIDFQRQRAFSFHFLRLSCVYLCHKCILKMSLHNFDTKAKWKWHFYLHTSRNWNSKYRVFIIAPFWFIIFHQNAFYFNRESWGLNAYRRMKSMSAIYGSVYKSFFHSNIIEISIVQTHIYHIFRRKCTRLHS